MDYYKNVQIFIYASVAIMLSLGDQNFGTHDWPRYNEAHYNEGRLYSGCLFLQVHLQSVQCIYLCAMSIGTEP